MQESTVKFHVVGLKCLNCGSYNTCRIKGSPCPGIVLSLYFKYNLIKRFCIINFIFYLRIDPDNIDGASGSGTGDGDQEQPTDNGSQ